MSVNFHEVFPLKQDPETNSEEGSTLLLGSQGMGNPVISGMRGGLGCSRGCLSNDVDLSTESCGSLWDTLPDTQQTSTGVSKQASKRGLCALVNIHMLAPAASSLRCWSSSFGADRMGPLPLVAPLGAPAPAPPGCAGSPHATQRRSDPPGERLGAHAGEPR